MKLIMLTLALALGGCVKKTTNQRSKSKGSSAKSVEAKDSTGKDEKPTVDPEKTFQVFLSSLRTINPDQFKEHMVREILKFHLEQNASNAIEKGRCFLVSTKEPFSNDLKSSLESKMEFVNVSSFFVAASKATTMESTDCVRFFKDSLGFRFETHYLSQTVGFFSYNF
ncbi:MAG: hypothetical protein AB7T49_13195 [Oligoflexales bacterium]